VLCGRAIASLVMGVQALALVLTAAVLHAIWNLAAKRVQVDGVAFVWLYVIGSIAVWAPIAVVWTLVRGDRPDWAWVYAGLLTALFHIVYQLVLQRGYQLGDLNLVYPLARGTGPLLTFLFAVTVLGDRPDAVAVLGVLAVIAGVLLISLGGPRRPGSTRSGVLWGIATGVAIAAYTLWDNHAVNALAVPPLPYFVLGLALQVPALTVLLGRRRVLLPTVWREARGSILVVALLSPMAYILVLRALQIAPVALVAPARESSIVVGALLSWWVLREPSPGRRLVGAVVVLLGIVGIVAG
jgi:drug/metabolite transporter (DMT)-like permease